MYIGNWNNIDRELDKIYIEIFKDIDVNNLDFYTKRKMIFEYLSNSIEYDFELLEKIKLNKQNPEYRVGRNPFLEIESVFKYKKGICNAIAQVYKLLLEKVGIYSLCVICDNGYEVKHQLNLVYDEENNSFSFDDVTSVILNMGSIEDFFDYDIVDANKLNQGCRPIYNNKLWMFLPTYYIYNLIGRFEGINEKYSNFEESGGTKLPEKIVSYKKRTKKI